MIQLLLQRVVLALCMIGFFTGCSTTCRQWNYMEMITSFPSYNSGRMSLEQESLYSYLEVELIRTRSGVRMYLNVLLMQAKPCEDNQLMTPLEIVLPDQTLTVAADLFQGGQHILIPQDITDLLVQNLLDGQFFTIKLGSKSVSIIPDNFQKSYTKLLAIPILAPGGGAKTQSQEELSAE